MNSEIMTDKTVDLFNQSLWDCEQCVSDPPWQYEGRDSYVSIDFASLELSIVGMIVKDKKLDDKISVQELTNKLDSKEKELEEANKKIEFLYMRLMEEKESRRKAESR